MYIILGAGSLCYLYLSQEGKKMLDDGGGLVGVLMGVNIATGLIWLSLVLGWGLVKIPIYYYKHSDLES